MKSLGALLLLFWIPQALANRTVHFTAATNFYGNVPVGSLQGLVNVSNLSSDTNQVITVTLNMSYPINAAGGMQVDTLTSAPHGPMPVGDVPVFTLTNSKTAVGGTVVVFGTITVPQNSGFLLARGWLQTTESNMATTALTPPPTSVFLANKLFSINGDHPF